MTISVFTPIHRPDAVSLHRAAKSLQAQTRKPDEWIILLNGEAATADWQPSEFLPSFARVHVSTQTGNVGALKSECCRIASGEILVELDYDDELTPDALDVIHREFEDKPDAVFVYSNFAEVNPDGSPFEYGAAYGWRKREFGNLTQMVAFPETAQYMRRIEWAPNHVRAFMRSAYMEVGGYDTALAVGDDHDLICRFYLAYGEDGFSHIDRCLYIYHRHDGNTSLGKRNAEVQAQVERNYIKYSEAMYLRWAKDNDLLCLDLGGRFNCPDCYESVDLLDADHIADLNKDWPFSDDSAGVIRAYHVLEHLDDTIHFFNEAFRVLAPGGFLLIEVPSVSGGGAAAFGDPTHKRYFHPHTFDYFTDEQFARFIRPQYNGLFQEARKVEYLWQNPERWIISAHLIALKGFYNERWCGLKKA
jgi:SAM-dependent methyltransferase